MRQQSYLCIHTLRKLIFTGSQTVILYTDGRRGGAEIDYFHENN